MDIISISKIIVTFALLIVMVFMMMKKLNGSMVLISLGLATMFVVTLITGESVLPDASTGSRIFDVFQVVTNKFIASLPTTTLQVMCVMGYVAYMNHIKASEMMTHLVLIPLKKMKSKYVAVIFTLLVGTILRIFLPSQVGLSVLFYATLYPVLRQLGFSRTTSASACAVGTMMDWGPGCPNAGWVFNQDYINKYMGISEFFVKYQIPATLITILSVIIVFVIMTKISEEKTLAWEAKEFGGKNDDIVVLNEDSLAGVPKFYGLLPLLPIVFVVIFSDLCIDSISVSVHTAHIFSFILVFILNLIVSKKKLVENFNSSAEMFKGMGNAMTSTGVLCAAGTTFTQGLTAVGGPAAMIAALGASNLGGSFAAVAGTMLTTLIGFVTGSGAPGLYAAVPLLAELAEASNINVFSMVLPILISGGIGRTISFVSPAILIGSSTSGVSNIKLAMRNWIPCLVGLVVGVIASFVIV